MISREKAIELLSVLVRIPSVNPRMGGGQGEGAVAAFVAQQGRMADALAGLTQAVKALDRTMTRPEDQ